MSCLRASTAGCFGKNGGDDGTRTRDLCRDRVAWLGFTTTYKTAGTAKLRGSHIRRRFLWAGLWVGKSPQTPKQPHIHFFLDSFRVADNPGTTPFNGHKRVCRYKC